MKIERFTGINNRVPPDRFKADEGGGMPVHDAINVDLSAAGTFQSRAGTTEAAARTGLRSAFTVDATGALVAADDELMRFSGSSFAKVADLGSSHARVGYVKTPLGIAWSDGFVSGIVRNWVNSDLVPDEPNPFPGIAVSTGGSLPAGTYGLSFAAVRNGQRSAMTYPVYVDVPAGGRVTVTTAAQPLPMNIYITAPDGEVFYRAGAVQDGSFDIATAFSSGESVAYEVQAAIPPGRILAYRNGRLLVAVGSTLFYTQPFSFLHRPAYDFIPFAEEITLLAAVDAGVFVATTTKTWFFPGDITQSKPAEVAPYGAATGTLSEVPNSTDLMWFTPRGQLRAGQDGQFTLLQDKQIAFPSAPMGASLYRESNGMRQFISSLSDASSGGSGVGRSFFDLE